MRLLIHLASAYFARAGHPEPGQEADAAEHARGAVLADVDRLASEAGAHDVFVAVPARGTPWRQGLAQKWSRERDEGGETERNALLWAGLDLSAADLHRRGAHIVTPRPFATGQFIDLGEGEAAMVGGTVPSSRDAIATIARLHREAADGSPLRIVTTRRSVAALLDTQHSIDVALLIDGAWKVVTEARDLASWKKWAGTEKLRVPRPLLADFEALAMLPGIGDGTALALLRAGDRWREGGALGAVRAAIAKQDLHMLPARGQKPRRMSESVANAMRELGERGVRELLAICGLRADAPIDVGAPEGAQEARSDVRTEGLVEGEPGRAVRDPDLGHVRHEGRDPLAQGDAREGRAGDQGAGSLEVGQQARSHDDGERSEARGDDPRGSGDSDLRRAGGAGRDLAEKEGDRPRGALAVDPEHVGGEAAGAARDGVREAERRGPPHGDAPADRAGDPHGARTDAPELTEEAAAGPLCLRCDVDHRAPETCAQAAERDRAERLARLEATPRDVPPHGPGVVVTAATERREGAHTPGADQPRPPALCAPCARGGCCGGEFCTGRATTGGRCAHACLVEPPAVHRDIKPENTKETKPMTDQNRSAAIVRHAPPSAAMAAPGDFGAEHMRIVREAFAPTASQAEFEVMWAGAKARGLDPVKKQIFFIKRYDAMRNEEVWASQVSIDGFRSIAASSALYDGQDEPEYEYDPEGRLLLARVRVYRRGVARPFVGVARWNEYVQTKKNGDPTHMWRKMEHTMLSKCAEALGLRKAFPELLSGLHTADEMSQAESEADPILRPEPKAPPQLPASVLTAKALLDRVPRAEDSAAVFEIVKQARAWPKVRGHAWLRLLALSSSAAEVEQARALFGSDDLPTDVLSKLEEAATARAAAIEAEQAQAAAA